MSRSVFAQRFRETAGETPMDYLARWRMLLAGEQLEAGQSVASIAPDLGYESESAFTTAFKRVMGCTPRDYGRQQKTGIVTPPSADASEPKPANLEHLPKTVSGQVSAAHVVPTARLVNRR